MNNTHNLKDKKFCNLWPWQNWKICFKFFKKKKKLKKLLLGMTAQK